MTATLTAFETIARTLCVYVYAPSYANATIGTTGELRFLPDLPGAPAYTGKALVHLRETYRSRDNAPYQIEAALSTDIIYASAKRRLELDYQPVDDSRLWVGQRLPERLREWNMAADAVIVAMSSGSAHPRFGICITDEAAFVRRPDRALMLRQFNDALAKGKRPATPIVHVTSLQLARLAA